MLEGLVVVVIDHLAGKLRPQHSQEQGAKQKRLASQSNHIGGCGVDRVNYSQVQTIINRLSGWIPEYPAILRYHSRHHGGTIF